MADISASVVATSIEGHVTPTATIQGDVAASAVVSDTLVGGIIIREVPWPIYDGPTEIAPGEEEQVLQTDGTLLQQNITVAAIPANYGLITWDGSKLTVS